MTSSGYGIVEGTDAFASVPSLLALPESREEGRETEAGPSDIEPLVDFPRELPADLDRDRGGLIAGGGKGGGPIGKFGSLSPPGTCGPGSLADALSGSTGENVTDFFRIIGTSGGSAAIGRDFFIVVARTPRMIAAIPPRH